MTPEQTLAVSIKARAATVRELVRMDGCTGTYAKQIQNNVWLMQADLAELQAHPFQPLPQGDQMTLAQFEKRNWRGDLE